MQQQHFRSSCFLKFIFGPVFGWMNLLASEIKMNILYLFFSFSSLEAFEKKVLQIFSGKLRQPLIYGRNDYSITYTSLFPPSSSSLLTTEPLLKHLILSKANTCLHTDCAMHAAHKGWIDGCMEEGGKEQRK